jgi:hypothetical protein
LTFLGFQQFYLHGRAYPDRPLTPPIRSLIIVHGAAMAAWMLLFAVQPLLVATGRRRLHMRLGLLGAGLAAVVVLVGLRLGIESARVNPPDLRLWNLTPRQFMTVPLIGIATFGAFVAIGVWQRKRPAIHRPMMLLAMLAAMPAALDRIDAVKNLYSDTLWGPLFGPFFGMLAIGLLLFVLKWALTREFDRWFAIGYVGLVAISAGIMRLATTSAWDRFAGFLLG